MSLTPSPLISPNKAVVYPTPSLAFVPVIITPLIEEKEAKFNPDNALKPLTSHTAPLFDEYKLLLIINVGVACPKK